MAYTVEGIKRIFIHKVDNKDVKLPDPDPKMTMEEVQNFYALKYPELTNTNIDGPTMKDGEQIFKFTTTVGTKG